MKTVALLRGINLGGKNALPKATLIELFTEAGGEDVSTYIASGNVLFRASAAVSKAIPAKVTAAVQARFGFAPPVLLRTAKELRALAAANPFLAAGIDPKLLHVAFLASKPAAKQVATLDLARIAPDVVAVVGREAFLHTPSGLGKSKISNAWLDRTLGTISTVRTWNTVTTLAELAS
jgi:uncharacterized protein (DUF1697 family)